MWMLLVALSGGLALAQEIPEEEEGLDLPDPGDAGGEGPDFDLGDGKFKVADTDEEVGMVDYATEAKKRPAEPTHFHLEPEGKKALSNVFPMQVVALGPSWVKIELPVLVATDRASFVGEYPYGLRVVTEWDVGGSTTSVEQVLTAERIWDRQPTLAFFDIGVQDARKSAPVRVKVYTAALPAPPSDDPEAEPPHVPKLKERYAVTSVFFRPNE